MPELNLTRLYDHRFDGISPFTKALIWNEIATYILHDCKMLTGNNLVNRSILDPACGDGEFLNACIAHADLLCGCDLKPRPESLDPGIEYYQAFFQDLSINNQFSLIWVSNLLEHLPSPGSIQDFLQACMERLTDDGIIVIMGPNIKYCASSYWDFADHLLPLSHLTVVEHLAAANLKPLAVTPRFLPYSFKSRLPAHPLLTRLYLRTRAAWPVLGRQFLIRATKA